jgi:hypothetical protein
MSDRCQHQPVPDTCYTLSCLPANLQRRDDYPVDAVCMHCARPIRCAELTARNAGSDWVLKYTDADR